MPRRTVRPLALLLFLATPGLQASEAPPVTSEGIPSSIQSNVELGYGHEHYSAPLVRFNDSGPLIEIVGRRHASGDYRHLSASVMRATTLDGEFSLQTSASLWDRQFGSSPDLNVRILGVDASLRRQLGTASVGIGPSFQHIASGGRAFRDRAALQSDWTQVYEGRGYTSVVLESGDNRHSPLFRDMDSRSSLLLLRRQITAPWHGVQDISFETGAVREQNRFGYADLSSRQLYLRSGIGFPAAGLEWNINATLQRARFDAPLLEGQPARRDIFRSGEISASYSLGKSVSLRWSLSGYQNKANVALYEGNFRGQSLSLSAAF